MDGKTVAITRSQEESKEFMSLMSENNANALPLPTIELVSKGDSIVNDFIESIRDFDPDYSVFMSSKAVKLLFDSAKKLSMFEDLQLAVANTTVLAVGPKTKDALEGYGIKVNHMPDRYSSVGVGEVFTRINAVGKKVIVPRSGASTPFLKLLLEKIGLTVKELYLYDVKAHKETHEWEEFKKLLSEKKIDGIIFTSASSVRAFFEIIQREYEKDMLNEKLRNAKIVAIGPFTAEELRKFDMKNIIADEHTVHGAFDTIKNILSLA